MHAGIFGPTGTEARTASAMWRRHTLNAAQRALLSRGRTNVPQTVAAGREGGVRASSTGSNASPSSPPWERSTKPESPSATETPSRARARRLVQPAESNAKLPAAGREVTNRRLTDTAIAGPNSRLSSASAVEVSRAPRASPPEDAGPLPGTKAQPKVHREPGSLRDALEEHKIALPAYSPGQYRIQCPLCRGGTDGERSLAVKVMDRGDTALWICHRGTCGWEGSVTERLPARAPASHSAETSTSEAASSNGTAPSPPAAAAAAAAPGQKESATRGAELPRPEDIQSVRSHPQAAAWFAERGISLDVVERNGVGVVKSYNPASRTVVEAIMFPYRVNGVTVNAKFRQLGDKKAFWQSKGGDKILYGLDDMDDCDAVIIVEGEMDKLAMEQAGFRNCISVPDGAPAKVKDGPVPAPEEDRKFSFLWTCRSHLDRMKHFIIATDADEPGQALAEELARRLGREKCFRVNWPGSTFAQQRLKDSNSGEALPPPDPAAARKDANEVLMKDGAPALVQLVNSAEPIPIRGLFRFSDFEEELDRYFGLESLSSQDVAIELAGVSTGWANLDELYKVVPGELTIVTGVPNSGKSEWVDALMCNLAARHGWNFALCSMENKVTDHARKLIEKYVGKPFFSKQGYAQGNIRMSTDEYARGKAWLDQHFALIRHEDDEVPSIDWIIGLARSAVLRYGIKGLLIDPYNELDHRRPSSVSETEYVSQMLTRVKRFAAHHDVHVWFVAHPRQMHQWRGGAPGLYDISGSAHFVNKCDNGIVVHRIRDDPDRLAEVKIILAKVRNKVSGKIGEAVLKYDRTSGRYVDIGLLNKETVTMGDENPPSVMRQVYKPRGDRR